MSSPQVCRYPALLASTLLLFAGTVVLAETIDDGVIIDRLNRYDAYPTHLYLNGVHHIWFCGRAPGGQDAIFLTTKASSLGPGSWSTPLLVFDRQDSPWATVHTCDPSVVRGEFTYNSVAYELALFYTADDGSGGVGTGNAIGVAFSNDGISWMSHPTAVIQATDPSTPEYGAGQSSVSWLPGTTTLTHLYNDTTTTTNFWGRVVQRTSTDAINHSALTFTMLTESGVSGNANGPDAAFNPVDRRWYAVLNTNTIPPANPPDPDLGIRLVKSRTENSLLGEWTALSDIDTADTGETTHGNPGVARNETGTLFIDEDGYLYQFFEIGEWRPDVDTWRIAQFRYRFRAFPGPAVVDTFTRVGPLRATGSNLHGRQAEVSGSVWTTDSGIVFDGDAAGVASSGGNLTATIPVTAPSASSPIVEVSADVDVAGSSWIAIGISDDLSGGLFTGELWMLLQSSNGQVEVWANGLSHQLLAAPAPYLLLGSNQLRLAYDDSSNRVSAFVNGVRVLDDFDLDALNGGTGFDPVVGSAGFQFSQPESGTTKVDNFSVNGLYGQRPGDWDGDGQAEVMIYRDGAWFVYDQ